MAYIIRGQQEKFKKFVYSRGNLYSHCVPMAKVGVISWPLTGSNAHVTHHLRYITLRQVLKKRYPGLGLHRRHRGLHMKGKS